MLRVVVQYNFEVCLCLYAVLHHHPSVKKYYRISHIEEGGKQGLAHIIGTSRQSSFAETSDNRGKKTIMSAASQLPRRIVKETQRLIAEPVAGISATPYADNLRYFAVSVEGPSDSPYEKGVFQLELFLPSDYPMAPPKVRFLTKIYHPNVDKLGRICLDILKDKWSPALQIRTVLLSIQALLSAPNPDDPLDNAVAEIWKSDEKEALRRAREFTESFAIKK